MARFSSLTRGLSNDGYTGIGTTFTLLPEVYLPAPSGDTTGVTDAAAITAAIAALPSGRGIIKFQRGTYFDNTQRSFNSAIAVKLAGVTGQTAGASAGTLLVYTGSATNYITAGGASGFSIESLQILYNNASFTGTLIDLTSGGSTPYPEFSHFYFGSSGGIRTAAAILNLTSAQDVTIRNGAISDANFGIIGRSLVGNVATAVAISNVHFINNITAHVKNAGEAWVFDDGCVFEPLVSGGAGAYSNDFATGSLTFDSCWFGDVTIGGTNQISFTGSGLTVQGCTMGNNALGGGGGIVVNTGSSGIDIRGNKFSFMGTAIDLTAANIVDADVGPNDYVAGTVTTPIAGGASLSKSRRRAWAGILSPDFPHSPVQITVTASRGYYGRFVPSEDLVASKIAFIVSTAAGSNDNVDVGIYDSTGTRLTSAGSTAGLLTPSGRKTLSFTPVTLRAGKVYYAAIAAGPVGTTAAIIVGAGWNENSIPTIMGASLPDIACGVVNAFPLGAGPVALLNTSPSVALLGVMQ